MRATALSANQPLNRARPQRRCLFGAAVLMLLFMTSILGILWPRYSSETIYQPPPPALVSGDKRFAEREWVITIRGADYGLIQWSGNEYHKRSTLVLVAGIRIEIPGNATWVIVAGSAGGLLLLWGLAVTGIAVVKRIAGRHA